MNRRVTLEKCTFCILKEEDIGAEGSACDFHLQRSIGATFACTANVLKINPDIRAENNTKVIMNELGDIFTALPSNCIWVYQMPWTFGAVCTRKRRQENKGETVESPPHVTFWWKTTFGIDKNSLVSPQEQELTQRNQITQLARHRIISNWKNCIQYHWNSIIANFEKE